MNRTPRKLGIQVQDFPDVLCVAGLLMGGGCERQLAISVIKRASAAMASRSTSSDEEVGAYTCIFCIGWTEGLMRAVSTQSTWFDEARVHQPCDISAGVELSGHARRGSPTQLRTGSREAWSSVDRDADAYSSSWWAFIELKGLTTDAS